MDVLEGVLFGLSSTYSQYSAERVEEEHYE